MAHLTDVGPGRAKGAERMRKNLRGFLSHLQHLTNRLVVEEFKGEFLYDYVGVWSSRSGDYGFSVWTDGLARWDSCCGGILLNLSYRDWFLKATEEDLVKLIRHELVHGMLWAQGLPHEDDDIEFVREALKRGVDLDPEFTIDAILGKGEFERLVLGPLKKKETDHD
jgi:hypothetical protein